MPVSPQTPESSLPQSSNRSSKSSYRQAKAGRALLRTKLLKASHNRCVYCGTVLNISTLTMDHVYPQNCGGPDIFENLVSACGPCNTDKAHLHPEEWFRRRPVTAAGFLLLARHVCPQYLALAGEILAAHVSPSGPGATLHPPQKLRFMASKLPSLLDHALHLAAGFKS